MITTQLILALLRTFFPSSSLLDRLTPDIIDIVRDIIVSAVSEADSAYADGDNVAKHSYVDGLLSSDSRLVDIDITEDIRAALIRFFVKVKRVSDLF